MTDNQAERSPLQKFADARRIVGPVMLPMLDSERPTQVVITDRVITVILSVERWHPVRGGVKITHRGVKWLSFERKECTDAWRKVVVNDSTERLAEPLLCLSSVDTEADQLARLAHEAMYRSGERLVRRVHRA